MTKRSLGHLIGSLAFLVGVFLAIVAGILSEYGRADLGNSAMTITLVCIGLIVGLFNVTHKESNTFMISGAVLIIASIFGMGTLSTVPTIAPILTALLQIFVPATILVAIRNVFSIARD